METALDNLVLLRYFEINCYVISIAAIVFLVFRKDYETLFRFGSGAIFGTALELMSVNLMKGYHYNPDFLINIGVPPGQFMLFGGIMWGLLMALSIRVAERFRLNTLLTGLVSYLIVVGWDFFLDVIAIRIHGGFWVWEGAHLDYAITAKAFYGVPWTNYLGYAFVLPIMTLFVTFNGPMSRRQGLFGRLGFMLLNAGLSLALFIPLISAVTAADRILPGTARALFFCVVAISVIWFGLHLAKTGLKISRRVDVAYLVFMGGSYLYLIVASVDLQVYKFVPVFFHAQFVILACTLVLGMIESQRSAGDADELAGPHTGITPTRHNTNIKIDRPVVGSHADARLEELVSVTASASLIPRCEALWISGPRGRRRIRALKL